MTCIVGIQDEKGVTIGGDSVGIAGTEATMRSDEKVFRLYHSNDFLLGCCGSFRFGQLLRYNLKPPKFDAGNPLVNVHCYLATDFVDAMRCCLQEGGFTTYESGAELGGFLLLGFAGGLYTIENDFQVGIPSRGYAATGDGRAPALGALFATAGWKTTEERVLVALEAAQELGTSVRAPFIIKTIH
jgi:ATP-dependent protease HslVU (ClpYQ) peptidase subunit